MPSSATSAPTSCRAATSPGIWCSSPHWASTCSSRPEHRLATRELANSAPHRRARTSQSRHGLAGHERPAPARSSSPSRYRPSLSVGSDTAPGHAAPGTLLGLINLDHRLPTAGQALAVRRVTTSHRHFTPALRQRAAVDLSLTARHHNHSLACWCCSGRLEAGPWGQVKPQGGRRGAGHGHRGQSRGTRRTDA